MERANDAKPPAVKASLRHQLELRVGFRLSDVDADHGLKFAEIEAMLRTAADLSQAPEVSPARGISETLARAGMASTRPQQGGRHLHLVPPCSQGAAHGSHSQGASGAHAWDLLGRLCGGRCSRPAWTIASAVVLLLGAVKVGLDLSFLLTDVSFFC